jgi:Fe-S-cluster containining protein
MVQTHAHQLRILQDSIDARADSCQQAKPDWPCRKGCDHCCRHLAGLPEASLSEWDTVTAAIREIPAEVRLEIAERILVLEQQFERTERPYVCPFLDSQTGSCRVYLARPLACRTYGFFVRQGEGLYCSDIEQGVEDGVYDAVTWGNISWVEAEEKALGPKMDLLTWWHSCDFRVR